MEKLTFGILGAYSSAQIRNHNNTLRYKVDELVISPRNMPRIADTYKLILTPLSAISDEDAVEVAKMSLLSARYCWERWGSNSSLLSVGKEIANDLFEDYGDPVLVAPKYLSNIIDYLRSRNYDLGYMGIRSLIDADIAISSTDKTETK